MPCRKGNEAFQLKTEMEHMHLSHIKMTAKDYSKKEQTYKDRKFKMEDNSNKILEAGKLTYEL